MQAADAVVMEICEYFDFGSEVYKEINQWVNIIQTNG
jgi:hypothetical protein